VLYVDPQSNGAAEGTRANPFATVVAALATASPGDIVAVGRGDHVLAPFAIRSRVALVGACASETRFIASTASDTERFVDVTAAGVRMTDMTIMGARPGIGVSGGGRLSLSRVEVAATVGMALFAFGPDADLSMSDVVVRDTGLTPSGLGVGVSLGNGATAALSNVALIRNGSTGLMLTEAGTRATATDLIVADTLSPANSLGFTRGVDVGAGAELTLQRAAVEGNRAVGLFVSGTNASLAATDLFVTAGDPENAPIPYGYGLQASDGAQISLERAVLTHNYHAGVLAVGDGTSLELRDVIVSDTQASSYFARGAGVDAGAGTAVTASRVVLLRNAGFGFIQRDGAATLEDIVVARTGQRFDGVGGVGLRTIGGSLELTRSVLWENGAAAAIFAPRTAIALSDVRAADTLPQVETTSFGFILDGIGTLTRISATGNHDVGLSVSGGATDLKITDLRVSDTRHGGGSEGAGVVVNTEANADVKLSVDRAYIGNNDIRGVELTGVDSTVWLTDVTVANTRAIDGAMGEAIVLEPYDDGEPGTRSLHLTRALLQDNEGGGITLHGPGTELSFQDLAIPRGTAQNYVGDSLYLDASSHATGSRAMLSSSVRVFDSGTELMISDLAMTDPPTLGPEADQLGVAVFDATVSIERAEFRRRAQAAIAASCSSFSFETFACEPGAPSANLTLKDVVIRETAMGSGDPSWAAGLAALGGIVHVERTLFDGGQGAGIAAIGEMELDLRDVAVDGARSSSSSPRIGVSAERGVRLAGGSLRLTGNASAGLVAQSGATLRLADLVMTHNAAEPPPPPATYGSGLELGGGAEASIERVFACGNRGVTFLASDEGTELAISRATILSTLPAACSDSNCVDSPGGAGIVLRDRANGRLRDFELRSSSLAGLMILDDATTDARDGVIQANAIGINLQRTQVRLKEDLIDVTVAGNNIDYDRTEIAGPRGLEELDSIPYFEQLMRVMLRRKEHGPMAR
jgi:hypothetical protein